MKYCGNCGYGNSEQNNYCINCGNSLAFQSQQSNEVIDAIASSSRYVDLREWLKKWMGNIEESFYVSDGSGYVQFYKTSELEKVYLNLGFDTQFSKTQIKTLETQAFERVDGLLTKTFKVLDSNDNAGIETIISQVKFLFEKIFNSNSSTPFTFEFLKEDNTELESNSISVAVNKGNGKIIFWVVIVILCIIGYYNRDKASTNTSSDDIGKLESSAVVMAQYYVKKSLKSPSTAEFPNWDFKCYVNTSDSTFTVTSYVDAQNGFGAMIRSDYKVILKYLGDDSLEPSNWIVKDLSLNE